MTITSILDTTHATNVYGGVQFYIVGEATAATVSDPKFGQVVLTAKDILGNTRVPNGLIEDSPIALEQLLSMLFGTALAWHEDMWFLNGTGGGQPLGVMNCPALIPVAAEGSQVAATIVSQNIDKMWSRLLPQCQGRAVWLANPTTIPQLMSMSRDVGTGGAPVMMVNMAGTAPASMYNRPIIYTEHCQALGTVGDIVLADLTYYLIGDRQAMSMEASAHERFSTNETVFRFIERMDGKPWVTSAITPAHGDTLSPFVALATRS